MSGRDLREAILKPLPYAEAEQESCLFMADGSRESYQAD